MHSDYLKQMNCSLIYKSYLFFEHGLNFLPNKMKLVLTIVQANKTDLF